MEKTRRRYTEDFRRDAVDVLLSSGKSITEVAGELGIELYNLARWKNQFLVGKKNTEGPAEATAENMKRLEQENTRLARENALLKEERDILKKAMGIVSKQ